MSPQAHETAGGSAARRAALTRLGAVPARLFAARVAARWRRAAAVVAALQLTALALLSFTAAAHPYDGVWLKLAAATWLLWLAPLLLFARAFRSIRRVQASKAAPGKTPDALDPRDRLAAELDALNPAAPDVFRTARRPEVHNASTLDALEALFKNWEPRLAVPAAPRVFGRDAAGVARRVALLVGVLLFAAAALTPALGPARDLSSASSFGGPGGYGGRGAGLVRMLLPLRALAAIPAPRLTPLRLPTRVARGDSVDIEVEVAHVPEGRPVHARVVFAEGAREVRYTLTPLSRAEGRAQIRRFRFGPVTEDFSVRFTALNHSTRAYRIEMTTPPRLKVLEVTIVPPAYTRLPRETRPLAPARLAVLPGTRVLWSGTADRDVHAWAVSWTPLVGGIADTESAATRARGGNARPSSAVARGAGRKVKWERIIRAPGAFALRLQDAAEDGGARMEEGPWHLDVRPDAPPEITLLTPEGDGELPRGLKVPLVFRASDDFGLKTVRLHTVWRDAEGAVRAQGVRDVRGWLDPRDGRGAGVWDGTAGITGQAGASEARRRGPAFAPQPGETVELTLEAVDNDAVSGPKSVRSSTVRLRLPSAEDVAEAIGERERDAAAGLASALEREKRAQRALQATDKGKKADAPPAAGEWDVRRVLSDEPRRHLQELRRQLDAEIRQAEQGMAPQPAAQRRQEQEAAPPLPSSSSPQSAEVLKDKKELRREAEAMEKRLPAPEVARASLPERRRALEALSRDQKNLEGRMKALRAEETKRKTAEQDAEQGAERRRQQENRARLEDDLRRQLGEQEELRKLLAEQERAEAAKSQRAEAAARQQERAREDVRDALEQIDEAMRKGLENGSLGPEVLEKMDRVRELLEEVLDEEEKERLRREAGGEPPGADDLQRAMRDMLDKKDGLKNDLERAIRMLETMRDLRALRDLTGEMRALEAGQKEIARELEEEATPRQGAADKDEPELATLAEEQDALQKRLDQALAQKEALAARPSLKPLRKESVRQKMQEARAGMRKSGDQLRKPKDSQNEKSERERRSAAKSGADLAARKLAEAAAEMEKALASMDQGADMAEVRAVLEETLEFTRWLERALPSSGVSTASSASPVSSTDPDAPGMARVARWLSGRMDKLVASRPFESEALRRASLGMAAYADALSTSATASATTTAAASAAVPIDHDAVAGVRRHARAAARELLKWLNDANGGGGENEGDGQGDSEFGGGDQGQSDNEGTDGVARRMRGMSGKQMAANRLTQELLRELMQERGNPAGRGQPGGTGSAGSSGGTRPDGSSGGNPGRTQSGRQSGSSGAGEASGGGATRDDSKGASGGSSQGQGQNQGQGQGENSGESSSSSSSSARGAAANAQQEIADALESLAEGADDGGGAARKLRQLAEEARALERALRSGRLDPEALRKRQEQFRTRLLESADAMEERGQQRERRAEAYRGGLEPAAVRALPLDSLAAELRRRRDDARRLPLNPEQKRRVEWYYERLIGP